jgi:hypothetical protein
MTRSRGTWRPARWLSVGMMIVAIQACATGTGGPAAGGSAAPTTPGAPASPSSSAANVTPEAPPAGSPVAGSPAAGSPAAADALCALYTIEELSAIVGVQLESGETTGPLDTVCSWLGNGEGYALVQWIDDIDYWSTPSLAPGFTPLDGIGQEAFVVPEGPGEWTAQALLEDGIAAVGIRGPGASQEAAVALLESFISRH